MLRNLLLLTAVAVALVMPGARVMAEDLPARSPFGVAVSTNVHSGAAVTEVDFTLPAGCVLYAERLHFLKADGTELTPRDVPAPLLAIDKVTGHEKKIYNHDFSVLLDAGIGNIFVKFQGCTNDACYFPEKRLFTAGQTGAYAETAAAQPGTVALPAAVAASADWKTPAQQFDVVARQTGYVSANDFVHFLSQASSGEAQTAGDPLANYKKLGAVVTILLIVLGGLGLNLTPCVLPLIPINLAIIGAGRAAQSRRDGFFRGAAYGLGMAVTYGLLGFFVVLTGTKFGALNSTIWFNVAIAVIFIVMALAMFDVFQIDFRKFDVRTGRGGSQPGQSRSQWAVAFTMGSVAALLAGACVAPVVISVLLMATDMHAKGETIGLALPFLLGLGMALPWPFMGASLSFLPKPGKWMTWVKYGFGVVIIVFALYYGDIAYGLFRGQHGQTKLSAAPGSGTSVDDDDQVLAAALQEGRHTGKAVFVDFAASWCKNCEAMDLTVFNQTNVRRRLKDFIVVRYNAERPNESPARNVLDYFKVMGLPTYVVLSPKGSSPNQNKNQTDQL